VARFVACVGFASTLFHHRPRLCAFAGRNKKLLAVSKSWALRSALGRLAALTFFGNHKRTLRRRRLVISRSRESFAT